MNTQLTSLIQALLLKTHELAFEYSTLDIDHAQSCPLAIKSKELFRIMKQLNDLVRQIGQTTKPY